MGLILATGLNIAIALGALVASIAPLYATFLIVRRSTDDEEDERHERDLDRCRERVRELETENRRLERRELELMRQLFELQKGTK